MPEKVIRGILHVYDPIKGYGFVHRDHGKDVYVHYSSFIGPDRDSGVTLGTVIEYEVEEGDGRLPRAKNVTVVG
ncbi:cold-shock protein [Pseudoduganella sp. SL102]|uniref:cold-shock protein n=1 Tax=Pseudoduganella sp. SL102 TaxID=2995154 RepID=UPI0035A3BCCD